MALVLQGLDKVNFYRLNIKGTFILYIWMIYKVPFFILNFAMQNIDNFGTELFVNWIN